MKFALWKMFVCADICAFDSGGGRDGRKSPRAVLEIKHPLVSERENRELRSLGTFFFLSSTRTFPALCFCFFFRFSLYARDLGNAPRTLCACQVLSDHLVFTA